jgi:helicase
MDVKPLVLSGNSFPSFNPMQQKVLAHDSFDTNTVVSAPTAAGKTLIAELYSLHSVLNKRRKVVYTCPLRALAAEHYSEFKKKYGKEHSVKVTVSTGDFDSSSQHLQNYDIIFTTFEKLNSLIRHNADWLNGIGLLVVDELHEIDSNRGATLEVTITQLRMMVPDLTLLGLSATIPNSKQLAQWLGAELIESDYRPIPLKEGVHFDEELHFSADTETLPGKTALLALVKDTVEKKKKQALVFANTRKRAESIAKMHASFVAPLVSDKEKTALEKDAQTILNTLESPTEQCRILSQLVKQGISFHHAGLLQKQRETIETAFRESRLKVISATPTLSMGVNLPSHTVIIPSVYRYGGAGMERIPVREYKQMSGRAGRPQYDVEGRALLLAKSELDLKELLDEYVKGELEDISSHLGSEPVLRMHLLGLIAVRHVYDLDSLEQFFSKTFFALQYGSMQSLFERLQKIIRELGEMGFVDGDNVSFRATLLGKRVSELYLDPLSAFSIVQGLKHAFEYKEAGYLFLLANTSEFFPHFSVNKQREPEVWEQLQLLGDALPISVEHEMYYDHDLLKKFNSALVLKEWVNETSEQQLLKESNIQPGVLFAKLRICDWLCYATVELTKLLELKHHLPPLSRMRKRLQHGVREELVLLTEVRGIGRVRARRLFKAKIKTITELKKVDVGDLKKILGDKTAVNVKAALGQ